MTFAITDLRNNTIWHLYRLRDRIQIDPDYQRLGNIWAPENRQLLIDTILNGFDVPKLYLHKFPAPLTKDGRSYDYAIVDGRQRLETMWAFIDGHLALDNEFNYFADPLVKAAGMTYAELGKTYPELKADFDGFPLAVVLIETDELEMIEEMFSRLNEAAPLTAAEKRNALGGPIPVAIKRLAKLPFFIEKVPFPNKRYRHFDLAVKFLLAEAEGRVVDTKKARLDDFVLRHKKEDRNRMPPFLRHAQGTLKSMSGVFVTKDSLLRQLGMVMVYYHLFRIAAGEGWTAEITRRRLVEFNKLRDKNRDAVEKGSTKVDFDLVEFERYAQSPNDSAGVKFRLQVILRKAFGRAVKSEAL